MRRSREEPEKSRSSAPPSSQSEAKTQWYDVNPVKLSVGAVSVVQGSFAMVGGAGIAAVGQGALFTTPVTGPVGAVSGTAATALGTAKFAFGYGRFRRGRQQMWEAADEGLGDASWKNLFGWLPSGQRYDDPGEPTFSQYWTGLRDRARQDYWGTARDAVRDFFAFPGGDE